MNFRPAVDLPLKAKLFRGLADPSRLVVLDVLREGAKCVTVKQILGFSVTKHGRRYLVVQILNS